MAKPLVLHVQQEPLQLQTIFHDPLVLQGLTVLQEQIVELSVQLAKLVQLVRHLVLLALLLLLKMDQEQHELLARLAKFKHLMTKAYASLVESELLQQLTISLALLVQQD